MLIRGTAPQGGPTARPVWCSPSGAGARSELQVLLQGTRMGLPAP